MFSVRVVMSVPMVTITGVSIHRCAARCTESAVLGIDRWLHSSKDYGYGSAPIAGRLGTQLQPRLTDAELYQGKAHVLYWLCVTWHEYLGAMMHQPHPVSHTRQEAAMDHGAALGGVRWSDGRHGGAGLQAGESSGVGGSLPGAVLHCTVLCGAVRCCVLCVDSLEVCA